MKIRKRKEDNRISLMCWLMFLTALAMFMVTGCNQSIQAPTYDEEVEPVEEVELFGVVAGLDEVNGEITIHSIGYETETVLAFTGGADVRNKYGDVMPMANVELGSVVEVTYDANRDKLLSLYMASGDNVARVEEVSGAVFDYIENTVRINGTTYSMHDDVMAFSDNVEIAINEICSEDQLTVWMYNDKICSFYVELGHGYVRLSDYAGYIGGMVEIGYDVIVPVTEDMLLTVREGTYNLRIAKGEDVGTKKVEVIKNREVNISLADIAIEPKQTGSVMFAITPADAAVYIDGKRVNTEGAIDLAYGKHKINIIAAGYVSYSATFSVNAAYKIREYVLKKEGEDSSTTVNGTATESSTQAQTTTENSKESGTTTESSTESGSTTEAGTTTESSTESETEKSTDTEVKDVSPTTGEKTSNKVILSAPLGASVYFDGEYIGIAPISFTKVTGSHIITFSQTGYLSKSYSVNFTDDGEDVTLSFDDLVLISSLIE